MQQNFLPLRYVLYPFFDMLLQKQSNLCMKYENYRIAFSSHHISVKELKHKGLLPLSKLYLNLMFKYKELIYIFELSVEWLSFSAMVASMFFGPHFSLGLHFTRQNVNNNANFWLIITKYKFYSKFTEQTLIMYSVEGGLNWLWISSTYECFIFNNRLCRP